MYLPLIVFFIYMFIFLEICLKFFLPLAFSITHSNIYYLYLVWEDIENDLNRIVDFF